MFGRYPNSGAPITGSPNRVYAQALTYLSTSVATIVRLLTLFRTLAVNSTTTATIARLLSLFRTLSVTSTSTASIVKAFVYSKILAINSTSTATFVKAISKIFSTVVESTIALIFEKAAHYLTLAVNSITTSSFVKAIAVTKSVTSTSSAKFVRALSLFKTVVSTSTATLGRTTGRILSVVSITAASLTKLPVKLLSVTSTSSAKFVRAINKTFSTIVDNVLVVLTESAFHLVAFTVQVTSTASFKKAIGKILTVFNQAQPYNLYPLFPSFNSNNVIYGTGQWFVPFASYCSVNVGDTITINGGAGTVVVAINRNVPMYNVFGSSYVTGDQIIVNTSAVGAWAYNYFIITPPTALPGVTTIASLTKAVPKVFAVVSSTLATIIKTQLKALVVISAVTVSLIKFPSKVLTVTVNSVIMLVKQIRLTFAVLSSVLVKLKRFVIPIFGLEGALNFFAIDRIREVVVVKVRNVFAYKGNKNANKQ